MTPPLPLSHRSLRSRAVAALVTTTAFLACDGAPEAEPSVAPERANAVVASDSGSTRREREWIYPLVAFRS